MSVREDIASNLVTTLEAVTTPVTIKYVTREPFDFGQVKQRAISCNLSENTGTKTGRIQV